MDKMSYVTSFPKSGKHGGYNYFVQVDCRNSTEPSVAEMMKKDYCKNNQAFACMTSQLNVIENTPKRAPTSYSKYVAKPRQVFAEGSNASSGGEDLMGAECSPEEAVNNPEAQSIIPEIAEHEEVTPAVKEEEESKGQRIEEVSYLSKKKTIQ